MSMYHGHDHEIKSGDKKKNYTGFNLIIHIIVTRFIRI